MSLPLSHIRTHSLDVSASLTHISFAHINSHTYTHTHTHTHIHTRRQKRCAKKDWCLLMRLRHPPRLWTNSLGMGCGSVGSRYVDSCVHRDSFICVAWMSRLWDLGIPSDFEHIFRGWHVAAWAQDVCIHVRVVARSYVWCDWVPCEIKASLETLKNIS